VIFEQIFEQKRARDGLFWTAVLSSAPPNLSRGEREEDRITSSVSSLTGVSGKKRSKQKQEMTRARVNERTSPPFAESSLLQRSYSLGESARRESER